MQRRKIGKAHGEAALAVVLYPLRSYLHRLQLLLRMNKAHSPGCLLITVRSVTAWDTKDWQLLPHCSSREHERLLLLPHHLGFTGYNMKGINPSLPSRHATSSPSSPDYPTLTQTPLRESDSILAVYMRSVNSKSRNDKPRLGMHRELACSS